MAALKPYCRPGMTPKMDDLIDELLAHDILFKHLLAQLFSDKKHRLAKYEVMRWSEDRPGDRALELVWRVQENPELARDFHRICEKLGLCGTLLCFESAEAKPAVPPPGNDYLPAVAKAAEPSQDTGYSPAVVEESSSGQAESTCPSP